MADPISHVETRILKDEHNPQLLVTVTTEDGISGIGECWRGPLIVDSPPGASLKPIASLIDDVLGPACLGRDSGQIELLWQHLGERVFDYGAGGIANSAISGIDLAVWDCLGKRLHTPVAQLLGGQVHSTLPVYARLDELGSTEQLLQETQRAIEAGIGAVLLPTNDIELVREVRVLLGDEPTVMVDVDGRLSPRDTHRFASQLGEFDVSVLAISTAATRVSRQVGTPGTTRLAAGANTFVLDEFMALADGGAVDILQPAITKVGGLSAARRLSTLAELEEIDLHPRNASIGPSLFANMQWGFASRQTTWLEIPWLPYGQAFPCGLGVPPLVEGQATLPPGAGLGLPPMRH
ncbi:MAG: mandelate racemase/muconate lactonizing enzyme family protein [Acidobacteria bacterium]|nr:mandelate racemase/muconate lactonizing enzyme family protein [Acidobacteriota bacterium]